MGKPAPLPEPPQSSRGVAVRVGLSPCCYLFNARETTTFDLRGGKMRLMKSQPTAPPTSELVIIS